MSEQVRNIQWSLWGNQTVLYGAYTLLIGGIIGIVGGKEKMFLFWFPIGIYGLIFGLIICLLEYPRGKKDKGHSFARFQQWFLSKVLNRITYLKNFYFRSLLYLIICFPACLITPTFLGSVCIMFGCSIYVFAAHHGESWNPITEKYDASAKTIKNINVPPSRPPPRLPAIKP